MVHFQQTFTINLSLNITTLCLFCLEEPHEVPKVVCGMDFITLECGRVCYGRDGWFNQSNKPGPDKAADIIHMLSIVYHNNRYEKVIHANIKLA